MKYNVLLGSVLACLLVPAAFGATTSDERSAHIQGDTPPPNAIWLDSLDAGLMTTGWGSPKARQSVDGNPIRLGGVTYSHGIGSHASSEFVIDLKGAATEFVSMVGVDDEKPTDGSVVFRLYVDGKLKADSGVVRSGGPAKLVSADLTGAKFLVLVITDAADGINSDHGDWAGAAIVLKPGSSASPVAVRAGSTAIPAIAPVRGATGKPEIHGARIVGGTPGRDFMFMVPATGEGPLSFSAKGLPDGLKIDAKTGVISGSIAKAGWYETAITVKGAKGESRRKLVIVGGDHKLALTPPMGWNSWNVWAGAVDTDKVRRAADAMVSSGLAAHGYQFVNIDDTWEKGRDANGAITTNDRFPDMKALGDYVHGKGLKLGIYSSPGPQTCANYEGSYQHEEQDARSYAEWGIDYLKYDWCSYTSIAKDMMSLPELKKPYQVMRDALDKCGRDIVYSMCQYGMGDVWKWGAEVGGNCWRTTGDITDNWGSMSYIAFAQDGHEVYAGPGHWNDPDMLVVGMVGWGPNLHPTKLTPMEQLTHITMWSLISSPLLIGCDMAQLDEFTTALLCNDEVIDVNQDPLGRPAGCRAKSDMWEVWSRPLWDGTIAVGLMNRGPFDTELTAKWSDLGIQGKQPVRDLWQRKDLGMRSESFKAMIPAHGAMLLKIGKPNRTDW